MDASRTFEAPGARLHALESSPDGGPAVLFLHGWLDHAHSFDPVRERLPPTLRTVALDFRGMGQSAHCADGLYHLTDYLLDVEFALRALRLEQVHLVGHSLGGTVALLFAAARPEAVCSLTSIESLGPSGGGGDRAPDRMRRFLRDVHRTPRSKTYPSCEAAAARLRENNSGLSEAAALHLARFGTRAVDGGVQFTFDPAHRRTFGTSLDEEQTLACLRAIECPVQVIYGTSGFSFDDAQMKARLQALRARPPIGVRGGHHVHLDAPGEVAELIRSFISGV